jgi:hypothetical protein
VAIVNIAFRKDKITETVQQAGYDEETWEIQAKIKAVFTLEEVRAGAIMMKGGKGRQSNEVEG